jgi:RNA polymerase sigma-70 factor, ECF subfamily
VQQIGGLIRGRLSKFRTVMENATTTYDLLERIRAGDREAFTPLFERYQARIAAFLRYRMSPALQHSAEVEDLLQETFLRAYREFERFQYQGQGSFLRWLMSIAGHVAVDTARYLGREKRRAEMIPLWSESRPGGANPVDTKTPSRLLAHREGLDRLFDSLNRLPEQYREILLFAKVEGLSTGEMAERLGKSRENVALLLHRALKQFRQLHESGMR